jgi:hypothetical protein
MTHFGPTPLTAIVLHLKIPQLLGQKFKIVSRNNHLFGFVLNFNPDPVFFGISLPLPR